MRDALIIGLNYRGSKLQLNGCENDAMMIGQMCEKLGYNVQYFTDTNIPQKVNILSAIDRFVALPSDKKFFHYSGHGTQTKAQSESESDGMDEVFVCSDGYITDGEMRRHLIEPMLENQQLVATIDACHSGTILDLPWVLKPGRPLERKKYTDFNKRAIVFSACQDKESAIEKSGSGIFTEAFLSTMRSNMYSVDPNSLIHNINRVLHGRQHPQISFGYSPGDISEKIRF
jgi:hypothetical protein